MLANFFNSVEFRQNYDVSFSFRQSSSYKEGFKRRVTHYVPVYPVNFPDLSGLVSLPVCLPSISKRLVLAFLRMLLTWPILVYEVVVLFRLFKRLAPDILHINNGGYPGAFSARAAAIAGKLAGVPRTLMVVNNIAAEYKLFSKWLCYPIDRMVVWSVDRFVTGSLAAAMRLRTVLDLQKGKVISIHNGIAERKATASIVTTRQRLGLADFQGIVFGVVALLIPRKGHLVLLEAVRLLVSEGRISDKSLIILVEGSGPLREELVEYVINYNLAPWVKFVGDEDNVVDFMSALDVLILPSVEDEDFPNVILEAMALGKPVIATRLAGTPEQVIDGVTGLLVETRNAAQLADAIWNLIDNPDYNRRELGRAALNRFTRYFTSKIALDNYSDMYINLFKYGNH